jgi:branched-chain amino acid transport system ATP-binding protein
LELLGLVDLTAQKNDLPPTLSYVQRSRLGIARALASNPSLLLLDEPCAGMDHNIRKETMAFIDNIRNTGITIFLIEHNMPVVMDISDSIIVLDFGQKIAEGPPDQIKRNPVVVKSYLGEEE